MTLRDWEQNSWLKQHQTSKQEIAGLFSIFEREMKDGQIAGMSADGQFNHAYRAVLSLCTVLLYASGYAPAKGQSHHYRTILALPEILGPDARDDAAYLDQCRTKRNASEYDAANEVSDTEARELLQFARDFEIVVWNWMSQNAKGLI
jgi:hypothetical protein